MYKFPYYTEQDDEKVVAFIKDNSFAMVTGKGDKYPVATQIPLHVRLVEGKIFLEGHMMRKTDHHLAFEKNSNVLVLFTGPHCFISANWYTDPSIGSTWNYMTVHAKGKINFVDEAATVQMVKVLSDNYVGTKTTASFDNLSKDYIAHMVKAIVGFSIEVESIDNVFKLSQNRDEASQKNIIEQLKKRGDENSAKIAEEMEHRLN
ncbi:FMN-binding negative transcriptional regulator [Ferruginibacter sp.]|nr:FMN-binding negative transcriptional regulator [Ferruginibacter sp.]